MPTVSYTNQSEEEIAWTFLKLQKLLEQVKMLSLLSASLWGCMGWGEYHRGVLHRSFSMGIRGKKKKLI